MLGWVALVIVAGFYVLGFALLRSASDSDTRSMAEWERRQRAFMGDDE